MKMCSKCGIEKEDSMFYNDKNQKSGLTCRCKSCLDMCSKTYNINVERRKLWRKEYNKAYKEKHKEELHLYHKEYGRKWIREYRKNNPEKVKFERDSRKEYKKEYDKKHREKMRNRHKNRMVNDDLYKSRCSIRNLISSAIKTYGYTKKSKTYNILGCSFIDFKKHIESQFQPWMNWDNHGKCNGELNYGWDYDHIIPVSTAKSYDELIKLNHYTNFQPLCSKVNRGIKKNKINYGK